MWVVIILIIYFAIGINFAFLYIGDIQDSKFVRFSVFLYMTIFWLFYIISTELIVFNSRERKGGK